MAIAESIERRTVAHLDALAVRVEGAWLAPLANDGDCLTFRPARVGEEPSPGALALVRLWDDRAAVGVFGSDGPTIHLASPSDVHTSVSRADVQEFYIFVERRPA